MGSLGFSVAKTNSRAMQQLASDLEIRPRKGTRLSCPAAISKPVDGRDIFVLSQNCYGLEIFKCQRAVPLSGLSFIFVGSI